MGIGNLMKSLRITHHRLFFSLFLFFVMSPLILSLSVQNAYAMDITLAWDEVLVGNIAGYRLFYREQGQGYDYTTPDYEDTNNTCTIYDLDANTTYYFVVRAYDPNDNESGNSNEVNYSPSIPNAAPLKPVINSPSDGTTGCELMPLITTALYSDPENDLHSQSHWQVSENQLFSPLVLDTNSNEHLTELTVPHLVLEPNTTYYCRVQFSDAFSATSEWSDTIGFTTKPVTNDINADGIPDNKKIPDDVDLNEDGTYDNDQLDVIKCIMLPDNGTIVGINKASNSIISIEAIDTIDPATISESANRPSGLSFGLFSYRLQVDQPGATASVRIYFSEDISQATNFYKFDTINGWQDCTQNAIFNGDGRSITITIEDGGFGDSDGVANGIIVDPGGLVTFNGSAGMLDNGAKSTSGCFISTLGEFTTQSMEHDQNP